jgi:post-segregation antitoxin (ccd killing protein)
MPFIQVRNVDTELRDAAKQRAVSLGLDLSTYVRTLIERDLARPTMAQWLDQVRAHAVGVSFDAAHAVRESRVERESQLAGTAPR